MVYIAMCGGSPCHVIDVLAKDGLGPQQWIAAVLARLQASQRWRRTVSEVGKALLRLFVEHDMNETSASFTWQRLGTNDTGRALHVFQGRVPHVVRRMEMLGAPCCGVFPTHKQLITYNRMADINRAIVTCTNTVYHLVVRALAENVAVVSRYIGRIVLLFICTVGCPDADSLQDLVVHAPRDVRGGHGGAFVDTPKTSRIFGNEELRQPKKAHGGSEERRRLSHRRDPALGEHAGNTVPGQRRRASRRTGGYVRRLFHVTADTVHVRRS